MLLLFHVNAVFFYSADIFLGLLAQASGHDGQVPELIGVIKEGVVAGAQFSGYEEAVCQVQQISKRSRAGGRVTLLREELDAEPRENLRGGRTSTTLGRCAFFGLLREEIDTLVRTFSPRALEQTVDHLDVTVPHTVVQEVVDVSVRVSRSGVKSVHWQGVHG